MEKDAAGYPQGHTNPGTSRTSPATYPTSRAVLRGGGGGDVTSLPDTWVGNHPGLPGPDYGELPEMALVTKLLGLPRVRRSARCWR